MLLNKFLSEDTVLGNNLSNIPEVEMTNEGFRFEDGGIIRANMLSENAMTEINMMCQLKEVESCKLISEGAIDQAYSLQESVINNALLGLKKIVMKLWARMKEICSNVKLQFEKMFNKSAFLTDAEKALKNITDFKNLEFEGYEFTPEKLSASDVYSKGEQLVANLQKECIAELDKIKAGDSTEATSEAISNVKDALDKLKGKEFTDELAQKTFGCDYDKISEELFKLCRGGKDTEEKLSWDKNKCITAIKEMKTLSNKVTSVFDSVNINHKKALKVIDDCIAKGEKAAKDAVDKARPIENARINVLKDAASSLKVALSLANTVTSAQLQTYKEDAAQARNFIMAAIRQGRKNGSHAQKVNASTEFSFENVADNY